MSELNNKILAAARLPLRRPSTWRVLLVLVAHTSTSPAPLTVAEIADMTGISQRSVKNALHILRNLNIIRRAGRSLEVLPFPPYPTSAGFTRRQDRAVTRLLHRASKLLDVPEVAIRLPDTQVNQLGLSPPQTILAVYDALQRESTAENRRKFVRLLINLVNSPEVRGYAL